MSQETNMAIDQGTTIIIFNKKGEQVSSAKGITQDFSAGWGGAQCQMKFGTRCSRYCCVLRKVASSIK